MWKVKRFKLLDYSVAAASVAIALLLTWLLLPLLNETPSSLFFAAVAISAWYGGLEAGLLATLLAVVTIHYFLTDLRPVMIPISDLLRLSVFGLVSLLISSLNDSRKRNEKALRKQEAQLRLITNALPFPISYVDAGQHYRFNNQTYEEWFGRSPREINGKHLKEVLGNSAYQTVRPYVEAVLSGQKVSYEAVIPYKEGGTRYIHGTCIPDLAENGEVKGYVALLNDISDRKRGEQALRDSEERLRLALEAAEMGIWEGNLINGQMRRSAIIDRIFGFPSDTEALTYQEFLQKAHPEDLPLVKRTLDQAIKGKKDYEVEYRIVRPDTITRWVLNKGQVVQNAAGVAERIIGTCMDITKRKRAEEALQMSEARFRRLFESNLIGLVFGDYNGNITEANNAFLQLIGYSHEELRTGRFSWQSITPAQEHSQLNDVIQHFNAAGISSPYETELIRKDQTRVPVLIGRTVLEDYTNVGISFVLDLSDRKRAQTEKNRLLGELQESEERLRLSLEAAQMGMWDWKIPTGEITHSEQVDRLLGLEPGTFDGTYNTLIKTVLPADRPLLNEAVIRTTRYAENFDVEFRVLKPDNSINWIASIGKLLRGGSNQEARLIGVCMDITQRKQIEAELHRREQEFKALAENAPDIIVRVDKNLRYVYINPACEQATGISQPAFIGKTPAELGLTAEMSQLWEKNFQQVLTTGQDSVFENSFIGTQGMRYYHSRIVPELGLDGSIEYALSISRDITELKQAEAALRETNQTLEALIQASPLSIMVLDLAGNVKLWNRASERIFGWKAAEILSGPLLAIPEDKQAEFRENLQKTLRGQPLEGVETRRQQKNGTLIDVGLWTAPLEDVQGNLSCLSIVADITERKQAEEALRQSEERFRTLVDSMEDFVFTLDREQRYTGVYGRWLARTNSQPSFFLGKTLREILGHAAAAIHEEANQAVLAGQPIVYEWSFESQNGTQYSQTSLSPLRDAGGTVIGIVGVGRDITKRYRAEQAQSFLSEASKLLASSLEYSTTLNTVANLAVPNVADYCVIYVVEEGGKIDRVAKAHVDPEQRSLLDQLEQSYPLNLNQDHPVVRTIRTGQSELTPEIPQQVWDQMNYGTQYLQIGQSLNPKSSMIVPLIARGRTLGAITFAYTDSGRRYGQDDLLLVEELSRRVAFAVDNARLYRKSEEANRIKDEFLAIVSHELRTPLNAILGWATLLRSRKFDEATTAKALETIERNARSQNQLIEDLLDVSRILRGKLSLNFQPIDLVGPIEAAVEAVRPTAEAKTIALNVQLDRYAGRIRGDTNRLQQVVWNLLSNAIKFTPNGGRVSIELSVVAGVRILPSALQNHDHLPSGSDRVVQIQVTDTGQGINPEFLPFVFDRFRQADSTTTRSHGGLGLGLAIVRHLVEVHGGTVAAQSLGEGQGATFTVQFPQLPEPTVTQNPRSRSSQPQRRLSGHLNLQGLRILVVDDEADTRDFVATALKLAGATVTAVHSAQEALAAIGQSMPDVLVSDVGMPEEDGYSLIRKVRALDSQAAKSLPAIALTAYARESDRTQALAAGFQRHVVKPIEAARLLMVVAQAAKRFPSSGKIF